MRKIFLASIFVFWIIAPSVQAEMAEGDAWNVGSVFAAGTQCEMNGFMTQGQTTALLAKSLQKNSSGDRERIRDGYQQGLKRTAIYSKNNSRWISIPINAESCKGVQYAIDQYKIVYATVFEDGTQRLSGNDRTEFVRGAANSCISGRDKDELMSKIPKPLFEKYCLCYASGLADSAPMSDLRAENQSVMRPIIERESRRCYAAMKEEAMRTMPRQ